MQIKANDAVNVISTLIRAKLVPLLVGSPGIGKSQIYQQIADQYKLLLIDLRLSQCDITDLSGFPKLGEHKAGYVPMDTFPIEGDEIPEGYEGWLLLFDELTSAPPSLQAASYKIILDRMVGKYKLHKNCAVCAAGNLDTDNAIVEPMSTALQSRMVHLEFTADVTEWLKWAMDFGIDHRILSYIQFQPGNLYTFKPDHTDKTYACPRTWEFADRILKLKDVKDTTVLPMLSGCISEGVTRQFLTFCNIFDQLPSILDILVAPDTTRVSPEPSIMYAMCGSLSHHMTKENIGGLLKYIKRWPIEFQIVCVRMTLARDRTLMNDKDMQVWLTEHAEALF